MSTTAINPTNDLPLSSSQVSPLKSNTSENKQVPSDAANLAKKRFWKTVRYIFLIVSLVIVLLPVYVLLVTSFKDLGDASPQRAWALPREWTFENWKVAFIGNERYSGLLPSMIRTLAIVIPSSIISSILGSMNGFVLSRWRFPGANVVFTMILFGMFIPYQAVMIPLVQVITSTGIPRGIPSLILCHIVYGIPICTLIFRNYYEQVPRELIEASRVDGAGLLRTYFSVVLPISVPSFVVVLIWQFTAAWNDFLFALFLSSPQDGPVTYALNALSGAQNQNLGIIFAGAIIASLPTLVVYIALGKYFIGGLMSGSVKG